MTDYPPFKRHSLLRDVPTVATNSADSEDQYPPKAFEMEYLGHFHSPEIRMSTLAEVEKEHILQVLKAVDGNKSQASRVLGVSIKTLYNKLHEYGQMPAKTYDYSKIEEKVLAEEYKSHFKCIKSYHSGYGEDFKAGSYYEIVDFKQGYVSVKLTRRSKPRWLSASRFEGV